MSGNRFILVLGIILGLTACGEHAMDKDYSAMNTMPLRTECVGRLLVDLPQHGFKGWSADFDWAEVSRMRINVPTATSFWTIVEKRKEELESQEHDTEPSVLTFFQRKGENAAILLHRQESSNKSALYLERYLWLSDRGYFFKGLGEGDEIRAKLGSYSEIFTKLKPRSNIGIPQESGFCIDGAIVKGGVGEISASIDVNIPGWKGVSLSVGTGEDDDRGPPQLPSEVQYVVEPPTSAFEDLADFEARYAELAKSVDEEAVVSFDILRKRERTIAGFAGQEIAFKVKLRNGQLRYRVDWQTEFEGDAMPRRPGISISLLAGSDHVRSDYAAPPPEEDLFALWDAVLATLRQRPGAL